MCNTLGLGKNLAVCFWLATAGISQAGWQAAGDVSKTSLSGAADALGAMVTLDTRAGAADAGWRFGPVAVASGTRAINLECHVDADVGNGSDMRLSAFFSRGGDFPVKKGDVVARADMLLRGRIEGMRGLNLSVPRGHGGALNVFIELHSRAYDRRGNLQAPGKGRVVVRGIDVLSSTLQPAGSLEEKRAAYLRFAGRKAAAESLWPKPNPNKEILRLPGLLAMLMEVKDPGDPRLARFLQEGGRLVKNLRLPGNRCGPFEIFIPIASHVTARRVLGPLLTEHPDYEAFRAIILAHQSSWADYKSNGDGPPRRPIPDARSLADVPDTIDNGNFRLLVTAAGYLSAQEFPEMRTVVKDPKGGADKIFTRNDILREMDLYIRKVYHSIASRNTHEYGSPIYLAIDFAPIRMIAEYAENPEVKAAARDTLHWLFSSLAANWNDGHYVNSAGRAKGDFLGTQSALGFLGWLYLGAPTAAQATCTPFNVYMATPGSYALPPSLRPPADFPYVKREAIGAGRRIRVYTFHSRSFGLTCSMEDRDSKGRKHPKWDRDGFFKEGARHKLNWFHPYAGGFSPQWQNSAQPYAGRRNQANGRFYGTNPWSYVQQCRGTQIGLSDVREGYPFRQLYVTYPGMGSLRMRLDRKDTGWTLCHTGRVVFAFRSLKPPTKANDGKPGGPLTDWYDYKKNAWILEVAEAPASSGEKPEAMMKSELEAFHHTLGRGKVVVKDLDDAAPGAPVLSYSSPISGKTLTLDAAVYPIPADGEGMPFSEYPVLATYPDSPRARRIAQPGEVLEWLDGSGKPELSIDFSRLIR